MILEIERLTLRPFDESDAESVYEYAKDPDVGPIAGWPPHTSVENSRDIIRSVLAVPETYAICLKPGKKAIGAVGLMVSNSNLELKENEGEIGYWLGKPFWGQGIMTEAVQELIRHAFVDLHIETIWCGYFDGNDKSRRVQEKCGFVYHHTNKDIYRKLMDDIRTEHITRLTKEEWKAGISEKRIVKLCERHDLKDKAAEWFSSKWNVPKDAYIDSIEESFGAAVPSWYLCLAGDEIIAGMGVVENDFHNRPDLTPNVCAVFTEPEYRNQGICGKLLNFVCEDMKHAGIETLYLLTDHTGFYERYGWEYLCLVQGDGDEKLSRMYSRRLYDRKGIQYYDDNRLSMQKEKLSKTR